MLYLKISNLSNMFNQLDYKGLNIDMFIAGSQVYSYDMSYCILATNEEIEELPSDTVELTEKEYMSEKKNLLDSIQINSPIEQLKKQLNEQAIALAALIGGAV